MLGNMYFEGDGIDKNYEEAYFWLLLGEYFDEEAEEILQIIEDILDEEIIADIFQRAQEWEDEHSCDSLFFF